MSFGIDTARLRITRQNREEIIASCDQPALLREVIQRAERLAFLRPGPERASHLAAFDAFCEGLPCLIWQPQDSTKCHMDIAVTREIYPVIISVSRVIWTIVHVVSEQGPLLRGYEELLHFCGKNGAPHTGHGACINPAHLLRGTQETRTQLKDARRTLREIGVQV